MPKFLTAALLVVGFVAIFGYQNCARNEYDAGNGQSGQSQITATVVKPTDLDDCRVLLCTEDQQCIIPLKLDSRYIVEGNVIKVAGHENPEVVTTCMAGPVFEVSSVELVSGSMNPVPTPSP